MRKATSIRWTVSWVVFCGTQGCVAPSAAPEGKGSAPSAEAGAHHDGAAPGVVSPDAARVDGAPPPACVPLPGPDDPDDDFVDSNCDGIDGELERAVFVSPSGSDSGDGTFARPLRSVAQGVSRATGLRRDVYVCDGTYAESLRLEGAAPSVYGGYDCSSGERHVARATIAPPSGVALAIATLTKPLTVDHLVFRAPDATGSSESSVAVTVSRSNGVTLSELTIVAGAGADGAPGAIPETRFPRLPSPTKGGDVPTLGPCKSGHAGGGITPSSPSACAFHAVGGSGTFVVCPDASVVLGGAGGDGGNYALRLDPTPGAHGLPSAGDAVMDGREGERGRNGTPGAALGFIRDGAYVAANDGAAGGFGAAGTSGHGGPGGASPVGAGDVVHPFVVGSGGGQGGYAGCGGHGGLPGRGGGASIGVLSDDSDVSLRWVAITTGHGGRGGDGTDGNAGQAGEMGAPGGASAASSAAGQSGGRGGNGGPGGAGGPGGGGPSIGILARRTRPITVAVTYDLGLPGSGGASSAATAENGRGEELVLLEPAGDGDAAGATEITDGGAS